MLSTSARIRRTITARAARRTGIGAAALIAGLACGATPASAARYIEQAPRYDCAGGGATIRVAPPRVYANLRVPSHTSWVIQVERWNGRGWVTQSNTSYRAAFDYFGRNQTGWSVFNTRTGGRYFGGFMHVPVPYRGYYRVASAVGADQLASAIYIGGVNARCFMP
jgi:hypothetical protein